LAAIVSTSRLSPTARPVTATGPPGDAAARSKSRSASVRVRRVVSPPESRFSFPPIGRLVTIESRTVTTPPTVSSVDTA
jgi:hypothetical protein